MSFNIRSSGSYYATFDDSGLSTNRTYRLPNVDGTIITSNTTGSFPFSASFATTASYALNGGGGGGEVIIGGPTTTDWSQYAGTPNRYMLVSDGVTNDITASHILQLDTSNESINIYAGIEGYNDASIALSSNASVSAGNFYANTGGAGAGNFYGTASYATSAATASSVGTLRQNITVSGSMFFSGSLNTPVFVDYEEKYTTISASAGNLTVNLSDGNIFLVTLNDTVSSITISNPPKNVNVGNFTLIVNQIGQISITWPTSVTWSNGNTAPSLSGDVIDFFTFVSYNSGSNWYGFVGGQNYPQP